MAGNTISIKDTIDSLTLNALDPDSVISNCPRWYLKKLAVKGITEFTTKDTAEVGALRMSVDDNNRITYPADYVKLLRLSEILIPSGKLHVIGVDASYSNANTYLLDNLGRILLDSNNVELTGSGDEDIDHEYGVFDYSNCGGYLDNQFYYGAWSDYGSYCSYHNINPSFVRDITYREDDTNGVIQLSGRKVETVVLEYVTNPILNGNPDDMTIDTFFGDALEKFIIKEVVLPRRSITQSNKYIAKKEFEEALLLAKLNRLTPNINEISSTTNLM